MTVPPHRSRPDAYRARHLFGALRLLTGSTIIALIALLSLSSAAYADEVVSYKVEDGDSLLSLANHFGINPAELAETNGITDPDVLAVGQQIQIRVVTRSNPFGLMVPDRRDDNLKDIQRALEPPSGTAGLVADAPLPPSLLLMIATIGPVSALKLWQPALIHPAIIPAPIYSQFDGSIWSSSNCGPTSLSMALGAIGISVDQLTLRREANAQMGSTDPEEGMSWEALVAAAQKNGAATKGLIGGSGYRAWGVDDLKRELDLGHPVVLLLKYRLMPDHYDSSYNGDHYVVGLGFDPQGNLVYNDPAGTVAQGVRRRLTPTELNDAWSDTWAGLVRTAMAVYK